MISDNLKRQDIWWRMVNAYVPNLRPTGGDNYIGTCPHPDHDDKVPSFSVHEFDMVFHCFGSSCDWSGNAVDFAKQFGNDPKPFYVLTAKGYHIPKKGFAPSNKPVNSQNIAGNSKKISARASTNIAPQKKVAKNSHYCRKNEAVKKWKLIPLPKEKLLKGWVMEHIEPLQVHWSKSGECFAFPNIDADGKWQGCSLHKPKSGNSQSIGNCSVYPLGLIKNYSPDDVTYLVEGQKDCARIVSLELQGISYTHGALSTPKDLTPLSHLKLITIIYDNDKGGRDGTKKQAEALKEKLPTAVISTTDWKELPESFTDGTDISDVSDETIMALIGTEKTYNKGYDLMTKDSFLEADIRLDTYLIDKLLIERGVLLIASTDGTGKSLIATQLGYSLTTGVDYLDFKVLNPSPVMLIQFELEDGELQRRLKLQEEGFKNAPVSKPYFIAKRDDSDIFEDKWEFIDITLQEHDFRRGTLIVDNLYTSTDLKLSDNDELKMLIKKIERIKRNYKIAIVLIGHFTKVDAGQPLDKNNIEGGKKLTNWVNNVFLLGKSTLNPDLRIGKLVKVRSGKSDIEGQPFKLLMDDDTVIFSRGGAIENEEAHFQPRKRIPEIEVLRECKPRCTMNLKNNIKTFTFDDYKAEMEEELGYEPVQKTVYNWLNKLKDVFKVVRKVGKTEWQPLWENLDDSV
jgi:hypothetical protein